MCFIRLILLSNNIWQNLDMNIFDMKIKLYVKYYFWCKIIKPTGQVIESTYKLNLHLILYWCFCLLVWPLKLFWSVCSKFYATQDCLFFLFCYCDKIYIPLNLPFSQVQCTIQFIQNVVQPFLPSICRAFSSSQTETPYALNSDYLPPFSSPC